MPDESPGRIADLIGHPVEFGLVCGCTALKVAKPAYLIERLGPDATIAEAERRMICQRCRQRPKLRLSLEWSVSGGRDRRVDPPPLPDWVAALVEG